MVGYLSYCPDCGWEGYIEGIHEPCNGLGGGPEDDYPDTPLDDAYDDPYEREERDLAEMAEWR